MKKRIALSWSGGKDSCMALHKMVKDKLDVVCLMTTVPKETGRTFAHDENTDRVLAQSEALGISVEFIHCSYDTYSEDFLNELKRLKESYELHAVAFGDMYLEGHREWGEKLAEMAGLEPLYPLWTEQNRMADALQEFIAAGYKAEVIRVREDVLPASWVGRVLDDSFVNDVQNKPICPMGESGEYHTFVYDGPLFKKKIER